MFQKLVNRTPSRHSVYLWNITGSTLNALMTMVLLMIVKRLIGLEDSDIFSLAFSVGQWLLTIATFQVRVYQATDISERYSFGDYLSLRILSSVLMMAFAGIYFYIQDYTGKQLIVMLLMCLFRVTDAFSDVYQGMFQQKERLDLAGMSLSLRVGLSMLLFLITALLTQNLVISSGVLMLMSLLMLYGFDHKIYCGLRQQYPSLYLKKHWFSWRNTLQLCSMCLPLFLNAFLLMGIFNEPKLAIDHFSRAGLLDSGVQTYYSILFMPAAVTNLLFILFRPILTTLTVALKDRQYKRMYTIIGGVAIILLLFTGVALLVAYALGIPVLSLLYGIDGALAPYRGTLLIIILGGGIGALSTLFDNVTTVFRRQYFLVIAYAVSFICCKFLSTPLVGQYGLNGAAFSYGISQAVLFVTVFAVCLISLLLEKRANRRTKAADNVEQ